MLAMIEPNCARSQHPSGVEPPLPVVPELRQLRTFLAVAQELNFTRAAERLHMAQQAVSKSVAQLERELGVELVERTSHEVRLTEAGERLRADAREVVSAADAAFTRARDHGRGLAGSLKVGATPAVGTRVLRDLARALHQDAPELSIALREIRPGEIATALRDGTADVVLSRTARAGDLHTDTLAPTRAALVVPREHALHDTAALRDLDGERLLTWSRPGTPYTDLLVALARDAGARVTPVETTVTGATELFDLPQLQAVAIVPEGWPAGVETRLVALEPPVTLPLLALRQPGPARPAVTRLVELLSQPPSL
jgi:DNA-binding transcriptional LysR family regulator